jgi:hypothetical protein
MDEVDLKGILPFIIFLPYFFTIAAIKLSLYDLLCKKIKLSPNKIVRITGLVVLVLFSLIIAILLQSAVYYAIMESWSAWK